MEEIEYQISENELQIFDFGTDDYLIDWPMLYILTGAKEGDKELAYIGESNQVSARMAQHYANKKKERFAKTHFIYSEKFNKSVTLDFESKLIQLMSSEGKFCVTNKNGGIQDRRYYKKEEYDKSFYALWEALNKEGLVSRNIDEIKNTDIFKYSPFKDLSSEQEKAVNGIFSLISRGNKGPIIVEGAPGTGKTIVAIYLFKLLRDYMDNEGNQPYRDLDIALVVSPTPLRATLKKLFKQIYGFKSSDVIGPSELKKKHYDIAFVDEAHRLHQRKAITNHGAHLKINESLGLPKDATELDWVLKQVDTPVMFFDNNQVVGPSGINDSLFEEIVSRYSGCKPAEYQLKTQMRVKSTGDYLGFVRNLLEGKATKRETLGDYEFKIVDDFETFNKMMLEKEETVGLSRMLSGFAWRWEGKKDKNKCDIHIEGFDKKWNTQVADWVSSENSLDEVGCIHTIQGYDLNYGFVIIGNDLKYDPVRGELYADKSNYFDIKGSIGTSEEELLAYLQNIYYVLMTRGIRGTYLYVCNPELKEYMRKYVDGIDESNC